MKKMILFELLLLLGSCATRIPFDTYDHKLKNRDKSIFLGTGDITIGNRRFAVIVIKDTTTREITVRKLYKYK